MYPLSATAWIVGIIFTDTKNLKNIIGIIGNGIEIK